jgi:hypothetical protein
MDNILKIGEKLVLPVGIEPTTSPLPINRIIARMHVISITCGK